MKTHKNMKKGDKFTIAGFDQVFINLADSESKLGVNIIAAALIKDTVREKK